MGSSQKRGGKTNGKYPVSVVDNNLMMIQGEMNLDAYESGDWLVINHESSVRARNYPLFSVNQPPKQWPHPKPAMPNQPPNPWAQPVMPNQPPKQWPQPAMPNQPPKQWAQPAMSNQPPKPWAHPAMSNQPPKPWTQPAMSNQPPKPWAEPTMSNQPPKPRGQSSMLGRPPSHDRVTWGKFHAPSPGYVPRPPNFVNNNYGDMMGNCLGHPPRSNGQGLNPRGGYDGVRSNNGGSKRPPIVIDSDDSDDYDDDNEEDVEYAYGNNCANNMTKTKPPTKGVHQSLKSDSWDLPFVGPKGSITKNLAPLPDFHREVAYRGWKPAVGGPIPLPMATRSLPTFPPPPLRSSGNLDGVDGTDYDNEFSDEDSEWEDDDIHESGADQSGGPNHRQVDLDPRLDMAPPLNHVRNLTPGSGFAQGKEYCNPRDMDGKNCRVSRVATAQDSQHRYLMEDLRLKHQQHQYVKERILPGNSRPISGPTSCKARMKNGRKDVEVLSESASSEFDDDEESEFNDDANVNFGNTNEEKVDAKQTLKIPKHEEGKKQSLKHQKEQCGEEIHDFADDQLPMKKEKVPEQSNVHVSVFEDYKNRVKEVAKLVKFHIIPKHEVDTFDAEKEELMKIHEEKHEMKKRHHKEEQELEKQFAVSLKRFMEKQITVNADSDTSSVF